MSLTTVDHLQATQDFIDENPVVIELKRSELVEDGAGGYTESPRTTVATFTGRIVGANRETENTSFVSSLGEIVTGTRTLIAMPDVVIKEDDQFDIGDDTFEVVTTDLSPPWRRSASLKVLKDHTERAIGP